MNEDHKFILSSRQTHPNDSMIKVDQTQIGGENFTIIAGPCSVESEDQLMTIAKGIKGHGAHMLRGGAYKPRTSPYEFQGMKEEGLGLLKKAKERTGMPIVTEVMSTELIDKVVEYADVLQIGARNMQNFELLKQVGQTNKPVLLKRGLSATIEELLLAAEYIMVSGNKNVILCERGIRTFEKYTRNTLDISAIPVIKSMSHLPVIIDPSHAAGRHDIVIPLAKAAAAVGADGIMVEVHHQPELALSDGQQSLTLDQFSHMMIEVSKITTALGKCIHTPNNENYTSINN